MSTMDKWYLMISFTNSRLLHNAIWRFFCYKNIGSKALLMTLLENIENSTRSITLLLIGIVTLYTMCMPRWDTSRTNLNVWIVLWPFWVFPFWDCCMTGWDCYQNIWLSIQTIRDCWKLHKVNCFIAYWNRHTLYYVYA